VALDIMAPTMKRCLSTGKRVRPGRQAAPVTEGEGPGEQNRTLTPSPWGLRLGRNVEPDAIVEQALAT
jgi:hypothetical protein